MAQDHGQYDPNDKYYKDKGGNPFVKHDPPVAKCGTEDKFYGYGVVTEGPPQQPQRPIADYINAAVDEKVKAGMKLALEYFNTGSILEIEREFSNKHVLSEIHFLSDECARLAYTIDLFNTDPPTLDEMSERLAEIMSDADKICKRFILFDEYDGKHIRELLNG